MVTLDEKVRNLFHEQYPGCEVELEPRPEDGVGGSLVWKGFENLEQVDRQVAVRDLLRRTLGVDEERRVSYIFAFTPEEMVSIKED
jgi:hypothetical protein